MNNGFNNNFLLGFDYIERMLDDISKNSDNYPPYNIEKLDESKIRITIAVAGFCPEDLDVSVEDSRLIIFGNKICNDENREYIYRGIASRRFKRSFLIDKDMKVLGAEIKNGLLNVDLEKPIKKTEPKKIEIKNLEKS